MIGENRGHVTTLGVKEMNLRSRFLQILTENMWKFSASRAVHRILVVLKDGHWGGGERLRLINPRNYLMELNN